MRAALLAGSVFSAGGALAGDMPFLPGINLSGAEFADNWRYPSDDNVSYYLARGMRLVRLPIKWERVQPQPGGAVDPAHLREIDRIVSSVVEAGGYLALDLHNYMRRNGEIVGAAGSEVDAAALADFWARMARRYGDNPRVIFNLMNEPHDMDSALNVANQNAAISAIRSEGAENLILVSGNHYSGAHSFGWSDNPEWMANIVDSGDNYAFDLHQYLDDGSRGVSTLCIRGTGATALIPATDWLRDKGQRAILGEFNAGPSAICETELRDLLDFVAANDDVWIGWAYWAGGGLWRGANPDDPYTLDPATDGAPVPQMKTLRPHLNRAWGMP